MRSLSLAIISTFIVLVFPRNGHAQRSLLPHPTDISSTARLLYFHPRHFEFCNDGKESTILNEAFERYTTRILENSYPGKNPLPPSEGSNSTLPDHRHHHHRFSKEDAIRSVSVFVVSSDQSLGLQTSETYTLRINAPTTIIEATTVYGALRAMESLAQLSFEIKIDDDNEDYYNYLLEEEEEEEEEEEGDTILSNEDTPDVDRKKRRRRHVDRLVFVNETSIWDTPRFRHRGLLIDTARHFLPVSIIKLQIDAMEMAKLNVLHWHIVDDQSFPYQSEQLPELSDAGAFSADEIYSVNDIDYIVQYARARGVRVIPEFDMPGHAASWGKSHPELLTECSDSTSENSATKNDGSVNKIIKFLLKKASSFPWLTKSWLQPTQIEEMCTGPMDPTKESTFSLLWQLLREVSSRFPDAFIHLGGDEVDFDCWKNNKEIATWMQQHKEDLGNDVRVLLPYFVKKVIGLAEAAGKEAMVWQEALDFSSRLTRTSGGGEDNFSDDADLQLPYSTVVHVWKWAEYLNSVVSNATQPAEAWKTTTTRQRHSRRLQLQFDLKNTISSDAFLTSATRNSVATIEGDDDSYWLAELAKVTATHRAVLSAPWYINLAPASDQKAWEKYWNVKPLDFKASIDQKERVLGGQACVWGELVDETNALQKTWPLAAAVAERLWSEDSVRDIDAARGRMEEFRCKLVARGVPASPLGPGHCLHSS